MAESRDNANHKPKVCRMSSSDLTSSDEESSLSQDSRISDNTPAFPLSGKSLPKLELEVGSMTVGEKGVGVHHGHVVKVVTNYFGVDPREGENSKRDLDLVTLENLVIGAVKIRSETKNQFFPLASEEPCLNRVANEVGSAEEMDQAQNLNNNSPVPRSRGYKFTDVEITNMSDAPRMYNREYWLAQDSTGVLDKLCLPVDRVVVCHTITATVYTTPKCTNAVRNLQRRHIEIRGWFDIGYNFLIGGDGNVYEGRGWNDQAAHTKGHNVGSLGVAFIGNFKDELPKPQMLEAFHKLVAVGVKAGKISEDYKLVAQCQLTQCQSPGLPLVHLMTSWPHFDSSLPILYCEEGDLDV